MMCSTWRARSTALKGGGLADAQAARIYGGQAGRVRRAPIVCGQLPNRPDLVHLRALGPGQDHVLDHACAQWPRDPNGPLERALARFSQVIGVKKALNKGVADMPLPT